MATWEEVREIVQGSRKVHESMLRASDIEGTAGTCLHASYLLRMSLERFGGCMAVIRGGDGLGDGGAKDIANNWHGHYWVEGVSAEGIAFVADVTADQFGHTPVFFDRADSARSRYLPGNDKHVREAVARLAQSFALGV